MWTSQEVRYWIQRAVDLERAWQRSQADVVALRNEVARLQEIAYPMQTLRRPEPTQDPTAETVLRFA